MWILAGASGAPERGCPERERRSILSFAADVVAL